MSRFFAPLILSLLANSCEKDIVVDLDKGSSEVALSPLTYNGPTSLQLDAPFFTNKPQMIFGSKWGYVIPLDNGTFLTNAEIFNPTDFSWTVDNGSPDNGTWGVSLKKLSDGKIFLTSGTQGYSIYNQNQNSPSWSASNPLLTNRRYAKLELLPNNNLFIMGGKTALNADLNSTEIYNSQTGNLSAGPALTYGGESFETIALNNGKILIAGAYGPTYAPIKTSQLYDYLTNTISATGDFNVARAYSRMIKLDDGKILATAGDSDNAEGITETCELYDQATGQWTLTGSLTKGRTYGALGKLRDGRVLVTAGYDKADFSTLLNSVEIYNPQTGTWTTSVATLNKARTDFPLFMELPNGDVVIAGGHNNTEGSVVVEVGTNFTEELTLSSSGGDGSYTYTLQSGPGKISGNKYFVGVAGIANIKVTDGAGSSTTFSITVLAHP